MTPRTTVDHVACFLFLFLRQGPGTAGSFWPCTGCICTWTARSAVCYPGVSAFNGMMMTHHMPQDISQPEMLRQCRMVSTSQAISHTNSHTIKTELIPPRLIES